MLSIEVNELITIVLAASVIAIPLVTGLVEVIKRTINLNERFLPLASLVIGVGVSFGLISFSITGLFAGMLIGLAAAGLWDLGKITVLNK